MTMPPVRVRGRGTHDDREVRHVGAAGDGRTLAAVASPGGSRLRFRPEGADTSHGDGTFPRRAEARGEGRAARDGWSDVAHRGPARHIVVPEWPTVGQSHGGVGPDSEARGRDWVRSVGLLFFGFGVGRSRCLRGGRSGGLGREYPWDGRCAAPRVRPGAGVRGRTEPALNCARITLS